MAKQFLIFVACIFFLIKTNGQDREDKKLVNQLDQLISEKYKSIAPGCVVLVAKRGNIVYERHLVVRT